MNRRLQACLVRLQEASRQYVVHPRTATRAWQLLRAVEVCAPASLDLLSMRSLEMSGAMGNVVLTFSDQSGFIQVEVPMSGDALWYGSRHSFETSWTDELPIPQLPFEARTCLAGMGGCANG